MAEMSAVDSKKNMKNFINKVNEMLSSYLEWKNRRVT